MLSMIADHMENGFLENIIDMFKHDNSLYPLLGDLLGDERIRVRIGTVALVETLREEKVEHLQSAIPAIAQCLKDSNATIRGDAAYLLGIVGHRNALPFLREASDDEHLMVRKTAIEAIEEIGQLD
jgi:HEAT repeat protein